MRKNPLAILAESASLWTPPAITGDIPHGDMPGDKVEIGQGHIDKANLIFPLLLPMAARAAEGTGRVVICVCGGSGVGKSETASLLSHYFRQAGVGCYTLSGDNYPHRIPMYNDAERVRVFRVAGIQGMLEEKVYTQETGEALRQLWAQDADADPQRTKDFPWLEVYQRSGREALAQYLGTPLEQNYEELSAIIRRFKAGENVIRMVNVGGGGINMDYILVTSPDTKIERMK